MSQHAYQKNHNSTRLTQCAKSWEVSSKRLIIKNWPQSLFDAMHVSTNTKRYMLAWMVKLSKMSSCYFENQKKLRCLQDTVENMMMGKKCYIWYTGSFHIIITNPVQDIIQCLTSSKKHQSALITVITKQFSPAKTLIWMEGTKVGIKWAQFQKKA